MWPNPQESEEVLNRKLHFLCSVCHDNIPFLYPLKTPENCEVFCKDIIDDFQLLTIFHQKKTWFSNIFRGCRNVILAWNRLILHRYWSHKYFWNSIHSLLLHCVKMSVFGVILVCIFPHSDWTRRDTPYLCVFSPNAGKYGPEFSPNAGKYERE